jgi:hypothetical protein
VLTRQALLVLASSLVLAAAALPMMMYAMDRLLGTGRDGMGDGFAAAVAIYMFCLLPAVFLWASGAGIALLFLRDRGNPNPGKAVSPAK